MSASLTPSRASPLEETVSECHSEAQPKNLLFREPWKSRSLAFAQHDIQVICTLRQSRPGAGSGLVLLLSSVCLAEIPPPSHRRRRARPCRRSRGCSVISRNRQSAAARATRRRPCAHLATALPLSYFRQTL